MAKSASRKYCGLCAKDFPDNKSLQCHLRNKHGSCYVKDSSSTNLLIKATDGSFLCHQCSQPCGKGIKPIKGHYLSHHGSSVTVSIRSIATASSRQIPLHPGPPLPIQDSDEDIDEDVDMEDDSAASGIHLPSLEIPFPDTEAGGDSPGPQPDEDDEWETGSVLSDTSTEVMIEEDEDDIVPRSFNPQTPADCSPHDDCLELDEQLPKPSSNYEEEPCPLSAAVYGSEELCYNQLLYTHGYALNKDARAVICTGCHRGVPIDMLQTHSRAHHRGRSVLSTEEHAQVIQDLSGAGYRSSTSEKYHQLPGQKPVGGLEVLDGYRCPLNGGGCSEAFLAESTFVRHLSSHNHHLRPQPRACASGVQTLFRQGGLQRYFCVDRSLSNLDPSSASAYAYAVKMVNSLPRANIVTSDHDKDRASIHWFTRWPELLQPYITNGRSQSSIQALVAFPEPGSDPDWLIKIRDHGCRWWDVAELAHIKCSYRASVMLKSHQQYLGPWKVLREAESARRYCGTAISFVSFCLKAFSLPAEDIPTRFTDMQQTVLQRYQEYLMADLPPSRDDVEKFQEALSCVLFRDKSIEIEKAGRLACPVQTYIALLSLRRGGDFVKAGLITQPISRFLYLSRSVVLRITLRDHKDAEGFMRNLQGLCKKFLGTGEGKISDELISLKKYASSLAAREPGDPHTLYDPNYTALAYRGRLLKISRMQAGLNELISDTWKKLVALAGNSKIKVTVPPSMCEDVRSTDLGDTFINHVTTEPPTLPLLLEMSKHSGLSLLRATGRSGDDATFEVDPGASQEFFHAVKPIVEAIAFLVHATGSGPLRLSEVVDDRYCNGSSPRNLFIQHGLVFLLRRNLKSSSVRGCRSSVIHFPPVRVAELLIYYLAVIRPVEILLTASLGWTEQHEAYSQFLYVVKGRKLTPSGLSGIIAQHTSQHFGCRLTGLDFRHVLINMQSVFLPPIVDPSVQKFGDSQAGHSSRVANHIYGQRIDHLPGEQAALFVLSHHWCRKLHTFLGLGPETTPIRPLPYLHAPPEPTWWSPSDYIPPQPPSLHEMMRQVQLMINSSLLSAIEELATRCERALREAVFQAAATSSTIAASSNSPFAAQRSPTSLDDFCVLPSTPVDPKPKPDLGRPAPTSPVALEDAELLHVLSLYTRRSGSVFTSDNQRRLLLEVLTSEQESIIAVLPTGAGKSIAIFGPVLAESAGITVVVTCYAALRRQLAEQARSFGIRHLVWSDRNLPASPGRTSVRLVIMITDDIFTEEAQSFITLSGVVRIIVDEAHSSFLSDSYRPRMQSLVHLQRATVPKIFLTATLAPDHEQILADTVGVSLARTLVLRSPTARPNHQIQVVKVSRLSTPSSVGLQLASLLTKTWEDDQTIRGIIFVRSLQKLQQVSNSSTFPICTYHGKMSDQEKNAQLDSWLSDQYPARWMVATTALLHGIDYPRVDAVIFMESPFGLYDFVQGAGRAGRSGQESLVAIIYNAPPPSMKDESQYGCREEMATVLSTPACRRVSISKVMDGIGTPCSQLPNSLLCDFCEERANPLIHEALKNSPALVQQNVTSSSFTPRSPPRPPPRALFTGFAAQAQATSRQQHARSVRNLMEKFSGCFTCRIESPDHQPCHYDCGSSGISGCSTTPHRIYTCTSLSHHSGWIDWKKAYFLWPKDVGRCYFCGFPHSVLDQDHKTNPNTFPGLCRFSDTAIAAAWHVMHTPHLFTRLQRELDFVPGVDSKSTFALWLTQYGSDSEDIRLLSVFSWLCRQYYPDSFH